MKRLTLLITCAALCVAAFTPTYSKVENIVYYRNPQTGRLGLYLSFELAQDHRYQFQWTRDGVTFFDAFVVDTTGNANEVYESFNIPDPCVGLWPRVLDLGPTQ